MDYGRIKDLSIGNVDHIASEDGDDEEDDVGNVDHKWPSDWMRKYPDITSILVPTINPSEVDKCIPKHAFNEWVAIHERLITHDILLKCVERNPKSMNVKHFLDSWDDIIQVMGSLKNNNSVWSIVRRISLGATVYFIWNERNSRVFKGEKRKTEDLVVSIEWDGVCSDVNKRLVMRSASVLDGCLEVNG
ncbi:hypothetical protein Tco_0812840 [Tanacetum coccineum]